MKITRRIWGTVCYALLAVSALTPTVIEGKSSLTDRDFAGARDGISDDMSKDNSSLYTVGKNVQISLPNSDRVHYEVAGCVNPDDPNLMLVASMCYKEDRNELTYVYRSTDRGQSWHLTLTTQGTVVDGDPTCIFGPLNAAYYATYSRLDDGHTYVFLYRSQDNGKTWMRSDPQIGIDRPFLNIDRTGGPNDGTIYCTGKGSAISLDSKGERSPAAINQYMSTAAVMISRDHGHSLEGPYQRAAFGSEYVGAPSNCVVLSDGTLVFSVNVLKDRLVRDRLGSMSPAKLQSIRITGGGTRLEPATTVGDWTRSSQTGAIVPLMAVDPGSPSFKDRIYVVYIDEQSGRARVLLNYSSDQGKNWSRSRTVDDDVDPSDVQPSPNATNPSIAVNRNGVVAVGWADRRDSPDNLGWWYRMSLSFDGGETFLPSFKVASAAHSLEFGSAPLWTFLSPSKTNEPQKASITINPWHFGGGHTVDMLVDSSGVFYPVWVDNRTGTPQVWTTPVIVRDVAAKSGSGELARLSDVTSDVSLEFLTERYENATKTIHVAVRLKNKSSKTVYAPVKLRVISMKSEIGTLEAADPAVYQPTGGVLWDLSRLLKDGKLGPGEVSTSAELIFRLMHAKRPGQDSGYKFELCNLEARILASPKE
jgi:hypothetical protein